MAGSCTAVRFRVCGILLVTWMAWLLVGCREEKIVRYTVPKLHPDSASAASNTTSAEPARMLAAIVRLPALTWTIKAMGAPESIGKIEPEWIEFLKSLKFPVDGKPTFELPAGWRDTGKSSQFRDIILSIDSVSPPLEVAFTRMPADFELVPNVNRWRNQLGLSPIGEEELPKELKEVTLGDEAKLLLFDATGNSGGGKPGAMGVSPGASGDVTSAPTDRTGLPLNHPPIPGDSLVASPVDFDAPAGWTAGPSNPIVLGKFTKTDGDATVELSILALKADSPWEQNVEIWANGLGLNSLSSQQIDQQTKSIQVDSREAKVIELKSPDEKSCTQIVSVVVAPNNWIIKLSGSSQLVAAEQAAWDDFLKSIHFRQVE